MILHIILETKIEHCKSSEQTAILWTRYWWFLSKLAESYESNLSLFIRFGCGHRICQKVGQKLVMKSRPFYINNLANLAV